MKVMPAVRAAEKASIQLADYVISTNESYRQIAINRCGKDPTKSVSYAMDPMFSVQTRRTTRRCGRTRRHRHRLFGEHELPDGLDVCRNGAYSSTSWAGRHGHALVGSGDAMKDLVELRAKHNQKTKSCSVAG